jgi:hypothetical protein
LLDAPSQGAAQPLDRPVDRGVHVRSSGSYSQYACGFKRHRDSAGNLVTGPACVHVPQQDTNPTDVPSVASQDREYPIFGVRAGLGADCVVLADDRDSIHAEDNGKLRANSRTNRGSRSQLSAQELCFEKKGAASG